MSILCFKTSCHRLLSNEFNVVKQSNLSSIRFYVLTKLAENFRTKVHFNHRSNVHSRFPLLTLKTNPRFFSSKNYDVKKRTTLNYVIATGLLCGAMAYAAVPLYRIFCSAYSYGGTITVSEDADKISSMAVIPDRNITIHFNADISSSMRWNFKPQQTEIQIKPGETALAFYTARNPTNVPIIGISSYNVLPFDAGKYFVKIQCFCFEEQQLNPNEQVDMPVFFYIDPEFALDPKMEMVDEITLSYTFFEAREGSGIMSTIASYAKSHQLSQ